MSTSIEIHLITLSEIAAADIAPSLFVRYDATDATKINVASAAVQVVGVSAPQVVQKAGHPADFTTLGVVPVRAGGAIARGARITADSSGRAVSNASGTLGQAYSSTTAAGQIVYVQLATNLTPIT